MEKFQKTGAIDHYALNSQRYGFAPATDFREAMEIVRTGRELFEDLPSNIRKKFRNNPEEFLEFVQNPDNASELVELGLADQPPAEPAENPPAASAASPATTEPKDTPAVESP